MEPGKQWQLFNLLSKDDYQLGSLNPASLDIDEKTGQMFNQVQRARGGIYRSLNHRRNYDITTKPIPLDEKVEFNNDEIGTLVHGSSPRNRSSIQKYGLIARATGNSSGIKRRYGVFVGSSERGGVSEVNTGADIWKVNVPHSDLRKDPYIHDNGALYIERNIKPSEITLVGHWCVAPHSERVQQEKLPPYTGYGTVESCPYCRVRN
jgi:hypothetical protein